MRNPTPNFARLVIGAGRDLVALEYARKARRTLSRIGLLAEHDSDAIEQNIDSRSDDILQRVRDTIRAS